MIAITRGDEVIVGDVEYENLEKQEGLQRLWVYPFMIWFSEDYEIEKHGDVHLVYYGDEGLEFIITSNMVINLNKALKDVDIYSIEGLVSKKGVKILLPYYLIGKNGVYKS